MPKTRSIVVEDNVERLIVVSDIHGLTEPLKVIDDILNGVPDKLQVVAAGDYFVIGDSPAEVLEWVRKNAGEYAVRGNHDDGALNSPEGEFPPYTEAGALNRLDAGLKKYLEGLPHILELTWRGAHIRVTHDFTPSGNRLSWKARVPEALEMFADPGVDLTVCAHTHYPFIRKIGDAKVANCGAVSALLLGHKREDGGIDPKGDDDIFVPVSEICSTYLDIVVKHDNLLPQVERFQYEVDEVLQRLDKLRHPDIENLRILFKTGVCWC